MTEIKWLAIHNPENFEPMAKCPKCGRRPAQTAHVCPYNREINDDTETLCVCCDDCELECKDSI